MNKVPYEEKPWKKWNGKVEKMKKHQNFLIVAMNLNDKQQKTEDSYRNRKSD